MAQGECSEQWSKALTNCFIKRFDRTLSFLSLSLPPRLGNARTRAMCQLAVARVLSARAMNAYSGNLAKASFASLASRVASIIRAIRAKRIRHFGARFVDVVAANAIGGNTSPC